MKTTITILSHTIVYAAGIIIVLWLFGRLACLPSYGPAMNVSLVNCPVEMEA